MKFKSDIEVQAGLKDSSGSNGTTGQILSSNGTTVSWVPPGASFASDVQNEVKAGVAIGKGQAVYVTSADGTNIIVGLASNTSEATSSKTLGLLDATVAANGFANVIQIGRLEGLNTSAATIGDPVWLGTGGNLIYGLANKPYAPAHLVYIGVVTRVNVNNGEIFISVQNGFELKEIHDVDLVSTAPTNNDILAFEGGSVNLWKNKTIPAVLGYIPADDANVVHRTGDESIAGFKTFTNNIYTNSTGSANVIEIQRSGSFRGRISTESDGFGLYATAVGAAQRYGLRFDYGDSNFVATYAGDPNSPKFYVSSSSTVTSNSFYAPIYYDNNNTAYYLDPASSSNLYNVTANQFVKSGGTSSQFLKADGSVDSSIYVPTSTTITINGVTQDLSVNRSWTVTAPETDTLQTVTNRGATTSILSTFSGGISVDGLSYVTNNGYFRSGTQGFRWNDSSGNYNNVIMRDNGTTWFRNYIETPDSVRAPIFYDYNNTAYYGDFASTSNFNKLLLNSENSFNTTTPGLTSYGLTLMGGTSDYANGVVWTWGNTNAQAGVYVQSSGAYGTKMYFATTDSFATGSKTGMSMDHNGTVLVTRSYLQSDSSLRAPIFYDSNNTGYYLDPNSTSNLYSATFAGLVQVAGTGGNYNEGIRLTSGTGSWSNIQFGANTSGAGTQANQWIVGKRPDGLFVMSLAGNQDGGSRFLIQQDGRVQSPVYYDGNNTNFYLDLDGTSEINKVYYNSNMVSRNYGIGQIGVYASTRYQAVFSMGESYVLPADGTTTGNLYGLTWSHPNAGGVAGNLNTHGLLALENGTWLASLTGSTRARDDMRAPIFYDNNNTGYYVNPASTSNFNSLDLNAASTFTGGLSIVRSGGGSDPYGVLGVSCPSGDNYSYIGMTRNGIIGLGMGIDTSNNFWIGGTGGGFNAVRTSTNILINSGGVQSPIFYDLNNTANYLDPNGTSNLYIMKTSEYRGNANVGGTGEATWHPAGIYCGSTMWQYGDMYKNNSSIYDIYNGFANSSLRAPIFYDNNDTAYYLDPASTSNIRNTVISATSGVVGLTVNHSGTNGSTGSKFNAAGSGNTYGAITATFDACNYGTGIKIVTGLYSTSLGAMQFFNSSTAVGTITCTTTSTAYNTSSDYRLKENIVPMESSIIRLKELSPCRFNFINEPSKVVDGFIAHEVQEIIPEAVTGVKDELDYDGTPKYQGIDQSKIVPLLTAALQEAISKIEELENRLSILENK